MANTERFCSSLREQTINLYSQVLEYQIRLARQFRHTALARGIRDIVTADNWLEMATKIRQTDESIHTMLTEWSHKTIQHIDEVVSSLEEKLEESLSSIKHDLNVRPPCVLPLQS